jgi:hypothetical protein
MSIQDDHYVNPMQLDMRNYRWPLEETSLGSINKRAGEQIPSAMHTKQRRISRQFTPISSASSSPCLSCLFSPGKGSGFRLAVEPKREAECRIGNEYPRICAGETGGRDREDLRKDLFSKSESKVLPQPVRGMSPMLISKLTEENMFDYATSIRELFFERLR